MRLPIFAAMAGLVVVGCSSTPEPAPAPPPVAEAPPPPPAPAPPPDTCGALEHQHLIGRLRTEIPVPLRPEQRRVMCTTCPATMDYQPDRLNFLFNAETGRIESISCG